MHVPKPVNPRPKTAIKTDHAALTFYRDSLGFEITFQGSETDDKIALCPDITGSDTACRSLWLIAR